MTISIGFIPNKQTVMHIQDSEVSYQSIGLTQDIVKKIKGIDSSAVTGIIGNPFSPSILIKVLFPELGPPIRTIFVILIHRLVFLIHFTVQNLSMALYKTEMLKYLKNI